jgi:hypothetical protein
LTHPAERKVTALNRVEPRAANENHKKPYHSPRLAEFGHVAKLVNTQGGSGTDGGSAGHSSMKCL